MNTRAASITVTTDRSTPIPSDVTEPPTSVATSDGDPIGTARASANSRPTVPRNHRDQPVPVIEALARLKNQRKFARKPYVKAAEAEFGLSAWQIRTLLKLEPLATLFSGEPREQQPTLKELNVLKLAPRNYAVEAWKGMLADKGALKVKEATPSKTTLILKRWAIEMRTAQSGSATACDVRDRFDALDQELQMSRKANEVRDGLLRVKIRALMLLTQS